MKRENPTQLNHRTYCTFCPGYCCYRLEGSTLFITAEDINRIGRHFSLPDGEVRQKYIEGKNTFITREDGSCIFLSNDKLNKRCSIHEARPLQCKRFPYDNPCPYLFREDLLEKISPLVEASLGITKENKEYDSDPDQP